MPTRPKPATPVAETPVAETPVAETPVAQTTVLMVRHGKTPTTGQVLPGRAPGLHLSEEGLAQAHAVGARIAAWQKPGSGVAALYTSPLERTRETAAAIGSALGLKATVSRGLLECDFGEWTGASLAALSKLPEWVSVQRYPSGFRFPAGESFIGMQARIVETLATLVGRHPGENVVVVSHADPIKAAVAAALGTHLDLFQRIVVAPCSLTAIAYGPSGPTVLTVNSTGSLTELAPS